MDFKGQKLAEQLSVVLVTLFAVAGFLLGYARESFSLMMWVFGAGVALAFVATTPDWAFYNRNPLKWRAPAGPRGTDAKAAKAAKREAVPFWRSFFG